MSEISRRSFAESLAVAVLAPFLEVRPERVHLPELAVSDSVLRSPAQLAKALGDVIRTQYRTRLSDRDLETITRQIQTSLERVEQLRKVDLANGDEPDFVFTAVRPSRSE